MNFKWKYEKFIRTISWSPFFIHRRKVQKVIDFCCHKVCLFGYFCFPLHEKEVNFNKTLLILELHRQCGRVVYRKKHKVHFENKTLYPSYPSCQSIKSFETVKLFILAFCYMIPNIINNSLNGSSYRRPHLADTTRDPKTIN